jgi:quinone-modifying oxidoreductase subunit QmoC
VCPRTPALEAFPRKEMVWAQWGLKDKLLADADAWLCYQCNDCITHCPVDAKPGDVMAATRTLQINEYSFPKFMARVSNEPRYLPLAFAIPVAVVALLVGAAILIPRGAGNFFPKGEILFEKFISHTYIDVITLSLLALVLGLSSVGLRRFWVAINAAAPEPATRKKFVPSALAAAKEILTHKGFDDCTTSHSRLYAHLGIFYGFLMLVAATTGAFIYTVILPALGIDWHGGELSLPLWDPVKLIGNIGGFVLLFAASQAVYMRLKHPEKAGSSVYFDWFFVGIVYATGITGFAIQALRFADLRVAAYSGYLVHLVFIYALFAYFPYSKFAHLMYRTVATTHAKLTGRA